MNISIDKDMFYLITSIPATINGKTFFFFNYVTSYKTKLHVYTKII
jgi:hypothetical protein